MSKVRICGFGVSADGFSAGPKQSLDNPLGEGFAAAFQWFFATRTFQAMHGNPNDGETGVDDRMAASGFENVGAWILGRNMFGPVRGPWPDESWRGWWGDEPPYHVPSFVLTHHARPSLTMQGGTTFHFVTGGIHEALERARDAAAGKDVRIGGGVQTIQQYVTAQLVDSIHLAVCPVLIGSGENLFAGLNLPALGYSVADVTKGERATHLRIERTGS